MATPVNHSPMVKNKWSRLAFSVIAALAVLLVLVLAARWLRGLSPVQDFLSTFPGHSPLPAGAPVGLPSTWLGWQHFLNSLLILLIIRSGWQVRTTAKPPAYWTRNNSGMIRTQAGLRRSVLTCGSTSSLTPSGF